MNGNGRKPAGEAESAGTAAAALREKYDLHMSAERFCAPDDHPEDDRRTRRQPVKEVAVKTLCLYYTRTNTTKAVMEKIAAGRAVIVDPSDAVARRIREVLKEVRTCGLK